MTISICDRLPWNQLTLCGWIGEIIYSINISCAYFAINGMLQSLFIGIWTYHCAFHNMMRVILKKMNQNQMQSNQKGKLLLIEIIRFHNSAKDIFRQSADAFNNCILVLLISGMIFLACAIFQLDLVIHTYFYLNI